MNATVTGIYIYPIKGCHAIPLQKSRILRRGLQFDRHWMLVDSDSGKFLSQRGNPELACLHVGVGDSGDLDLEWQGRSLTIPFVADTELRRQSVSVWSFTGEALDCGDEAAQFFTDQLGFAVRLARVPDDFTRRVSPTYARHPDDGPGFADGFPLLLGTESSLHDLNQKLDSPIPMDRFRPNLVVAGEFPAWAEDNWTIIDRAGEMAFHVAKPCERCSVTTIDQETGVATGPEPLATLATFRRSPDSGKVRFGMNLIPADSAVAGIVALGDMVQLR